MDETKICLAEINEMNPLREAIISTGYPNNNYQSPIPQNLCLPPKFIFWKPHAKSRHEREIATDRKAQKLLLPLMYSCPLVNYLFTRTFFACMNIHEWTTFTFPAHKFLQVVSIFEWFALF